MCIVYFKLLKEFQHQNRSTCFVAAVPFLTKRSERLNFSAFVRA